MTVVAIEDVDQEMLERERQIELQKEDLQSKPENIRCGQRSAFQLAAAPCQHTICQHTKQFGTMHLLSCHTCCA